MVAERLLKTDDVRAALRADCVPDPTIDAVIAHIQKSPDLWRHFERFTLEAIQAKRRVGAKAIWERVRWEGQIETGQRYKASNNLPAYLARIFAAKYPEHRDYFRTKDVKGFRVAA